ncbi:MAG: hypothetical protein ABR950_02365 [Candidatus Dormibacteria bacterium]|jgi:hypothetical protein
MSSDQHLTLGALYREMRAGLGDAGRVRVTVEFQQRTLASAAGEEGSGEPASLVLETFVEYDDRVLDRAQVALHGAGPPKRFLVARHGSAYAYSLDGGERWGRLAAHPRIFDLEEFEAELGQILVEDATYDVLDGSGDLHGPRAAAGGAGVQPVPEKFVDALDVSMDRESFLRLLRIFSADVDDDPDAPALNAFSVSMQAADDVSLQYWWSLSDSLGEDADVPLKIRCSVSIRVGALGAEESGAVQLDGSLPDVADLDGVWAILRHTPPGTPVEEGGQAAL